MTTKQQMLIENKVRKIVRKIMNESFKSVKVTYANGTHITTSVNSAVSDDDIKKYFRIGSTVNIGSGANDLMTKIKNVEILGPDEVE